MTDPPVTSQAKAIRAGAPEATEVLAYRMPAFRSHGGQFLVSYDAYRRHYSLFPASGAVVEALGDEQGNSIGTRVFKPELLYRRVNGVPPDLICYFGNLTWRSIGTVGSGRIHVRENDTGPDDANHAKFGIYIFDGPGMPSSPPADARLFDIAPTVLRLLGQPVPDDMQGRSLV